MNSNESAGPIFRNEVTSDLTFSKFLSVTYAFLAGGLAITFSLGLVVVEMIGSNPQLFQTLSGLFFPILIVELLLVIGINFLFKRVSALITGGLFILYSAINAVFFGVILSLYSAETILITFLATFLTFIVMSAYGYITKSDLTKWGNLAFMGLIGFIIGSIINIFVASSALYWILTYIGIAVFLVLIAKDTQDLKKLSAAMEAENAPIAKYAIQGALSLYLDVINLFILLLRVFGGRD